MIDECFDILGGQGGEHLFTACFAYAFTAAVLLLAQYPEFHTGLFQNVDRGNSHLLHPGVVAEVATDEIEHLHTLFERFNRQILGPVGSFFLFALQGIAFGNKTGPCRAGGTDRSGKNFIFRGNPAKGHAHLDLLHSPGATVRASSAGRATPDVLTVDFR